MHERSLKFRQWISPHFQQLCLAISLCSLTVWTVIRHISNGVNFDVVGQIGMAAQWAHGLHAGAQVGPTNYLLKLPFYFVVNEIGFLSPHLKLLVLALVCNLSAFLIIWVIGGKFLDLYGIAEKKWLHLGLLWLAVIGGRVFWLDYANSRNLEVAGGFLVLYLALSCLKRESFKRLLTLSLVGTTVFFADPLQFYVIGAPLSIYFILRWLHSRAWRQTWPQIAPAAMMILSFIGSKILFWLSTRLLPIEYLATPTHPLSFNFSTIITSLKYSVIASFKIFDVDILSNGVGPNTLREAINLSLLIVALICVVLVLRKYRRSYVVPLVFCIAGVYVVFIAGGQALQGGTERYLIDIPVLLVLLFGCLTPQLSPKFTKRLRPVWLLATLLCAGMLLGAAVISWPNRYSKDRYIGNLVQFLQANHFTYAVASRQVAIPTNYFGGQRFVVAPTICIAGNKITENRLFYDAAGFTAIQNSEDQIAVLIGSGGVTSGNNTCSQSDIEKQLGIPARQVAIPNFGVADIYDSGHLPLHE